MTYDFDTITRIEENWSNLKDVVNRVSNYVFYGLLEMERGRLCDSFHFDLKEIEPSKMLSENVVQYTAPLPIVVQQFQNGSHIDPFPTSEFSYPLAWLNATLGDQNVFKKELVHVKNYL